MTPKYLDPDYGDEGARLDAAVRAALKGLAGDIIDMPEPTLGLKGGVNRAAVLALIDERLESSAPTSAPPYDELEGTEP